MRQRFGAAVHKVSVDAGFTCPNRDGTLGTTGCIYCNNDSFRPNSCVPAIPVVEQIRNGVSYVKRRYKAKKYLVYFQPYTNTYAPVDVLERLYQEALAEPGVIGLAIGTRPDAIDGEKVHLMESLAKNAFILIEYGMQSMYDRSLGFINRGHTYKTFLHALDLTRDRGIHIGAHIIVGFPTETREEMLGMADKLSHLPVGFLKIHHLQVIRATPLHTLYKRMPFPVFGYEEYLEFVCDFMERLSPRIVLQRLFATAPDNVLTAPVWGRSSQEILRDIEKTMKTRGTFQGNKAKEPAAIRAGGSRIRE